MHFAQSLNSFIKRLKPLLRQSNHALNTEAGRAEDRNHRIALSAFASAAARGTSMLTALVSVPLTLHYLGTERFGMWMTMIAFTTMLGFADLGIGNGVLSAVSRSHGRDELHTIKNYVSSAFALLSGIGLLILAVLALIYSIVPWHSLFNVNSTSARAEAGPAIATFIACFAASLPLGIVQRVQMGMQMSFMASIWQCISGLVGLVAVISAISMKASLPWLVLAYAGAPLLVAVLNNLSFFWKVRPDFAPRVRSATLPHARELAHIGLLFFVLQLAVAVTYTSDSFVIARQLGAEQVANFAVPDRLFAIASVIVGFATIPLWPAFSEALARGEKKWIRSTLIRFTLLAAGISSLICLTIFSLSPFLLAWWTGGVIEAPIMLLLGLAIWKTIEATVGPSSMFLNGLRAIRFQIITATTAGLAAVSAKILLIPQFGIQIVPWCTIFVYIILVLIPMFFYIRKRL